MVPGGGGGFRPAAASATLRRMKVRAWRRALRQGTALGLVALTCFVVPATSGATVQPPGGAAEDDDQGLQPVLTGPVVVKDVPYAQHGSRILALDVYRMQEPGVGPGLVLVHGGSWRRRSKEVWSTMASLYAREGYVVFAIDYRLAPPGGNTRFPDPIADVQTAIDWVRRNAGTYGVDPARVGVVGSSAGAHLTLLAAGADGVRPDVAVLFSPPVDLARLHRQDVLRGSVENFMGCPPEECPGLYEMASGRRAMDAATPPMLVAFSRYEVIPPDQPLRLVRKLASLGRPFETIELPGSRHGMSVAAKTFEQTIGFLARHL
jgi:acetyl esterase/lipase